MMSHIKKAELGILKDCEPCNVCNNKLWCIKNRYTCTGYETLHKKNRKNKYLIIGRRFGKTGMLYHTIVDSLPIPDEKKKELHDQYEKALIDELSSDKELTDWEEVENE